MTSPRKTSKDTSQERDQESDVDKLVESDVDKLVDDIYAYLKVLNPKYEIVTIALTKFLAGLITISPIDQEGTLELIVKALRSYFKQIIEARKE